MTHGQWEQLRDLIYSVQRVSYHAAGNRLPYELSSAIHDADLIQSDCYQFIDGLKPEPQTAPQPAADTK